MKLPKKSTRPDPVGVQSARVGSPLFRPSSGNHATAAAQDWLQRLFGGDQSAAAQALLKSERAAGEPFTSGLTQGFQQLQDPQRGNFPLIGDQGHPYFNRHASAGFGSDSFKYLQQQLAIADRNGYMAGSFGGSRGGSGSSGSNGASSSSSGGGGGGGGGGAGQGSTGDASGGSNVETD